MVITKDLGAVSAYAYAVEQGYQGTEEEFAELMARQATVAEEAAASADAAAESANEAQASAEQAEQSAQSISGDVERAEQAATTATGKATEAATSATTANGAAQTATGKAAQAEQSATAAASSASSAAQSASNAAASATAAQTAQTAAETAQGKAEDAQAAAEAAAASIDPDTLVKKTELENYARIDGSYETMTVGNAEQLVTTVGVDDSAPYNFRTSGGSVDIGDRETVNAVVGGTVAWNQLAKEINSTNYIAEAGVTATFANGVATFTSPTNSYGIRFATVASMPNHVYVAFMTAKISEAGTINALIGGTAPAIIPFALSTSFARVGGMTKAQASTSGIYWYVVATQTSINKQVDVKDFIIVDLTQMFGSTIADYIYGLEQANAGAGVAYFRKLFPKDYYEYNAGELLSVNTSQHKMVGFNQFNKDASYTIGNSYRFSDVPIGKTNVLYMALVDKNTSIDVSDISFGFCEYGANSGNVVEYRWVLNDGVVQSDHSNISSNGTYCSHVFAYPQTEDVWNRINERYNINVNLSWDGERDGEYEPYQEWVYPLDSSLTLRGIPKLDASNNLYYDGDTYAPDGTVTRRYGIVDLGTLTWTAQSLSNNRVAYITNYAYWDDAPWLDRPNFIIPTPAVCVAFDHMVAQGASYWGSNVGVFTYSYSAALLPANSFAIIKDSGTYADAAAFKAAMNNVKLVYELDTPTTETATPYTQIQTVDDFGTEEYTDFAYENGDRDVAIPVGHNTVYSPNLRAKLEMSPNSPDGDGLYVVEQSNGQNEYVPLVIPTELPTAPSEDGTYTLKITVSGGTVTKSWIAEE